MSTTAEAVIPPLSRRRLIQITALAWFAVIGLDFFLDAGLLARFYRWDLPGFLTPLKMFSTSPSATPHFCSGPSCWSGS